MPRIRKPKFNDVVEELKLQLGLEFTQERSNMRHKIGEEVVHSDLRGVGYVVGYRRVGSTIIAYFPESTDFKGAAGVYGCYSTSYFIRR